MATDLDKWEDRGLFDIGSGGQEPSKIEEGDISNLTYQKREKENGKSQLYHYQCTYVHMSNWVY